VPATLALWLAVAAAAGSDGPRAAAVPSGAPAAGSPATVTISVVGTNDLHGHLEALPLLGGYLANLRRARARDGGGVVLVDAGDMFQGTLASNLNEGAAVVRAYGALGYDAAALGNHEFDYGPVGPAIAPHAPADDPQGALKARAAEARFPFLDANLVAAATRAPPAWSNVRPTTIVEVAGVKVGIVGVTTIATPATTLPANFVGLGVVPLAPVVRRSAEDLRRRGAKLVVVAAHAGGSCRDNQVPDDVSSCEGQSEIFQLARALPPGTVDVIVAGHTHAGVAHRVAGVAIVESFDNGRAFGRVDVDFDVARGRVAAVRVQPPTFVHGHTGDPRPFYEGGPVGPDVAVATAIEPALAAARAARDRPVGIALEAPVTRAYKTESSLGNLFADLMRAARPGADVAITNGGAVRVDFPAGPLTYGVVYEAMPFDNRFATLPVTGAELAELVGRNLARENGILSVSGFRARARCVAGGLDVTLTRADGRPIAPGERLELVTSDYLATGGDGLMRELGKRAVIDEEHLIREALVAGLAAPRATSGVREARYDPAHPRLDYPGPRPVRCAAP
jgi:5'-nucleotidase